MMSKLRAVLIVGNGFSMSLLRHLGLSKQIDTGRLFPPPENVPKLRNWKEEFPLLGSEWDNFRKGKIGGDQTKLSRQFLEYLSRIPANPHQSERAFEYHVGDLSDELRKYLQKLFVYYDEISRSRLTDSNLTGWEWLTSLGFLDENFELDYVSYNYDCLLDYLLLGSYGEKLEIPCTSSQLKTARLSGHRLMLKPHGSISFVNKLGFENIIDLFIGPEVKQDVTRCEFPPKENPRIIDCLVPPGHFYYGQINNSEFLAIHDAVSDLLERAQLVILCGLSAAPPDTAEIEDHLKHLPERCGIIHVGLAGDCDNNAARLLKQHCSDGCYKFLNVQEMPLKALPFYVDALGKCIARN